jgi:hypothetical protein
VRPRYRRQRDVDAAVREAGMVGTIISAWGSSIGSSERELVCRAFAKL